MSLSAFIILSSYNTTMSHQTDKSHTPQTEKRVNTLRRRVTVLNYCSNTEQKLTCLTMIVREPQVLVSKGSNIPGLFGEGGIEEPFTNLFSSKNRCGKQHILLLTASIYSYTHYDGMKVSVSDNS